MPSAACQIRILFSDPLNLGPGKIRLLEAIREAGSISGAARHLHISYRRAWLMADALNKVFPKPLIDTAAGGVRGGGARLSELGEAVLQCYRRMETKAAKAVSKEAETLLTLAR
ncbi:MAG: LysR family transcriptional regulator [Hydrogenophilaceae bacterium]|nr:LysR family transcriptional regulator [Hydrogenophilaceae bacterium]